ncbi:MAG: hypothetical protein ACYTKD_26005 [Planctomycetota bacterium]|jgi:hypothetical protein
MKVDHRKQDKYLELLRQDKVPQGKGLGIDLDNHLRFKEGKLNVILGHSNVGKTFWVLWYLTALSNKYGHKNLIYSSENTVQGLKRNILELYANQKITTMTPKQLESNKSWLEEHFDFIEYDKLVTIDDFMKDVQKMGSYDVLMIDPLNSFTKPIGVNSHEHDYNTLTKLRLFGKKFNTTVYICMHGATEALRKTHKSGEFEGMTMPCNPADAEGGGKHVNRCDDFIVCHRYTQSSNYWMFTEVHIKKIKETESGGMPTFIDEPVNFKLEYGTAFTCNGVNALDNASPFQSLEQVETNGLPF